MKLYKIEPLGKKAQFAGSMDGARKECERMRVQYKMTRNEISLTLLDVNTTKAGLIDFLNKL